MRSAALIVPHTHTRKAMWKWRYHSKYLLVTTYYSKCKSSQSMCASQFIKGHMPPARMAIPPSPWQPYKCKGAFIYAVPKERKAIRFMPVFSPIPCAVCGVHYVHSSHSCVRCGAVHFINVPKCILQGRLTSWNTRHARGLEANGPQTINVLFYYKKCSVT